EASLALEKAVHYLPEEAEQIYYRLGIVYLKIGNDEQAIESFEKATRLNQELKDAYFYLGWI
ncbi:MAG: tetratricopeptide repeat protein, partial [Atribacterota bacterium]|nr:tetratricopeptide repeat protein [Atribacterota bacterium]